MRDILSSQRAVGLSHCVWANGYSHQRFKDQRGKNMPPKATYCCVIWCFTWFWKSGLLKLALPAGNVAVRSNINLDIRILYVLHGNKELILNIRYCPVNMCQLICHLARSVICLFVGEGCLQTRVRPQSIYFIKNAAKKCFVFVLLLVCWREVPNKSRFTFLTT